jgi:hypothetical protein
MTTRILSEKRQRAGKMADRMPECAPGIKKSIEVAS